MILSHSTSSLQSIPQTEAQSKQYTIFNQLQDSLFSARYVRPIYHQSAPALTSTEIHLQESIIVLLKSIHDHWRLQNEVDVQSRYQWRARLCSLLDEIAEPGD
ncbi:hypothetical protein ACMFMF_006136 [Clarireedia jacksonii]